MSSSWTLLLLKLTEMTSTQESVKRFSAVNSLLITGTITAKQKVRQKVPGLYAVYR